MSSRIPYHYLKTDVEVILELSKGYRPIRPTLSWFTDGYWHLIQQCWSDPPHNRPDIRCALRSVEAFLRSPCSIFPLGVVHDESPEVPRCKVLTSTDVTQDMQPLTMHQDAALTDTPLRDDPSIYPYSAYKTIRQAGHRISRVRKRLKSIVLRSFSFAFREDFSSKNPSDSINHAFMPASVLAQIGPPDHHGWLDKRASDGSKWKRRYLILQGSHLYWLRTDSPKVTEVHWQICCACCAVQTYVN